MTIKPIMKIDEPNPRRDEALDVLNQLTRRLRSITADLLYVSLIESGFSEDEACRMTGALIRTATARGWISKTDYAVKSQRNHSNLQSVYCSNIFGKTSDGKAIPKTEIKREYARWKSAGYRVPDEMAIAWSFDRTPAIKEFDYRQF